MDPVAFVAGATGFTGREVVRVLAGRGLAVIAHVRPDSPRLAEWRTRFEALGARVDATPWAPEPMAETLGRIGPTIAFSLLGTTKARQRRGSGSAVPDSYAAVEEGLTRLLLGAFARTGLAPRFVFLSSVGVHEGARSAYLAARWRIESAVRASGLPFTIARPSFIVGPGRDEPRAVEAVASTVSDSLLGLAGRLGARRLRDRFRSTTNVALAEALVRAALDPASRDRVLEAEDLR